VPSRSVGDERAALAFVEDVGICSTFYVFAEGLACLWEAVLGRANPRWPRRSHHDAGIGLAWTLKDWLPSGRHVYYETSPALLSRLFSVPRAEVDSAIARLVRRGAVSSPVAIAGRPGRWVVSAE
jgi:hypothetical protein